MKSIIFCPPPCTFVIAWGAAGCKLLIAAGAPSCGNTPEPYANAYRIGALNFHSICRRASLNSSLIIMCWLTPKFSPGRSLKREMLKSGLSSQSLGLRVDESDLVEPSIEGAPTGRAGASVFLLRATEALVPGGCPSFCACS